MLELKVLRKNKINLSDWEYQKDIENRIFLSSLTVLELKVLEEILFSSIKTSTFILSANLNISQKDLIPIIKKFERVELLKIDKEMILIDKKMRKYFEFEYLRFENGFQPDLHFVNNLLQKIPIHILPIWYSIPKSSNHIFKSIIEKYLLTPQIYKKYLDNIEHEKSIFLDIIHEVYDSDNLEVAADYLQKKYNLTKELYLEYVILLEFNFICFQSYKKTEKGFKEILMPLYEYTVYLKYLRKGHTASIENVQKINRKRNDDFGFVKDLIKVLNQTRKPISIIKLIVKREILSEDPKAVIDDGYLKNLIKKLLNIKFIEKDQNFLKITNLGKNWLLFDLENKALHLYYNPLNTFDDFAFKDLLTEKSILEAEKSICRIIKKDWVYFDDFIKGVTVSFSNKYQVKSKSIGKNYNYFIPQYTKEEILFIKKVIFEKLFETGIVAIGTYNKKDCFCVTKFGRKLFDVSDS